MKEFLRIKNTPIGVRLAKSLIGSPLMGSALVLDRVEKTYFVLKNTITGSEMFNSMVIIPLETMVFDPFHCINAKVPVRDPNAVSDTHLTIADIDTNPLSESEIDSIRQQFVLGVESIKMMHLHTMGVSIFSKAVDE